MPIPTRIYTPIENFIYLHHTDTFLIVPTYPLNITDSSQATFLSSTPLGRSAPIWSYSNSGPRSIQFDFSLHREMMNQVNFGLSNIENYPGDDYIDSFVKQIQAACLPNYAASEKLVDPPMVSVKIGKEIYIKGIINGSVGVAYELPILVNDKYAQVDVGFTVTEVDPYDAQQVLTIGSYRNGNVQSNYFDGSDLLMNTSLDRAVYSMPYNTRSGFSGFSGGSRVGFTGNYSAGRTGGNRPVWGGGSRTTVR